MTYAFLGDTLFMRAPGNLLQRLPTLSTQQSVCAAVLVAVAVLLGAMALPLVAGRVHVGDDLGAFHVPARAFYAQQLARGEAFDWMPQLYCGFYLTGEGQAGTYHPLHWLLYRWLPLQAALGVEWLLPYPLMFVGMWLWLRRRLKRNDAAAFGALVFSFGGFNLLHFIHPNAVAVIAHIPWLLWALDVVILDGSRRKVAAAELAIAMLTGSQLLLGYPQYVWFSLVAEASYATFLMATYRYAPREGCERYVACSECVGCTFMPWRSLLIAKGIGLLLGGVQLLPTLDAALHSTRPTADAAFANSGSLHPINLLQLLAPYLFTDRVAGSNTHELGLYVGAVPLLLVVWLAVRWRALGGWTPLARAAALMAFVALMLALGQYGVLYKLQASLPVLGWFRFPCRYLMLFQLAVAVMAALGFGMLLEDYRRSRDEFREDQEPAKLWRRFEPLWAVVLFSTAVALVGLLMHNHAEIAGWSAALAGPLLIGGAALLIGAVAAGSRIALVALVLYAAADLGVYGLGYAARGRTARLDALPAPDHLPPDGSDGRVVASVLRFNEPGLRTGNEMTLAGFSRADGYAGLQPERRLDYRQLDALRVAGVRWVGKHPTTTDIAGLMPYDDRWFEVPQPLDRVRLVSRAVRTETPDRDLAPIDVASTALTEIDVALPPSTPGKAALIAQRPGRLVVYAHCPAPQLLVVAESFHPGWQATVDSKPEPPLRVNGDFLGCCLGPGHHRVVFTFKPGSLRRGWWLSCTGVILASVCFLGRRRQTHTSCLEPTILSP